MQKIKISVVIAIATLTLFSCMSKEDREIISKIDTMLDECANIKNELKGTFLDSVNAYLDSAQINVEYFKGNTIPELPIDRQDLLQSYYHVSSVEKMLKNYKTKHLPQIEADLIQLEKQLNDLKHDIKNKLIEDELKEKYLQAEDSAYNFLTNVATERIDHARAHFQKYTDNHENVSILVEMLNE